VRAAYITEHGDPKVLKVGDIPPPEPGPGQVRVRVHFSSLNHLDIWIRKGLPGLKLSYPHILGADSSGIVDKVGPGTTTKVGAEVIVYPALSCGTCHECREGTESLCAHYKILGEHVSGTNAEFIVVPEANLFEKPKMVTFEVAAAFPLAYVTAWEMVVTKARVKAGQRVLVHGAGSGVSSAAIQIAKHFGAEVIATSTDDRKLDAAKAWGADTVVNSRTNDFAASAKKVDVIIDHVGQVFWEKNIRCLKTGGILVTCGATSGFDAKTDLRHVFFRQLRLVGSTMGSRRDFPDILRLIREGKLSPIVDKTFPLEDIAAAHMHMESAKQVGKILISL